MKMLWTALLALSAHVVASPLSSSREDAFELKHSWPQVPKGWELHSEAPADHVLNLHIGLKESNIDRLIAHLYEVSDPTHARYGEHLSKADVDALVAPPPDTVDAVDAWLRKHDIDPSSCHRTTAGDWLQVSVTVSKAERMFGTKYNVFRHTETGDLAVRTLAWNLPRSVHSHIDVAQPTTKFSKLRKMEATYFMQPEIEPLAPGAEGSEFSELATLPSSCNSTITPSCLRMLYGTANYTPNATDKNMIGITGYLDEFANTADLQTFFSRFRSDASGSFTTVQVNGGGNDQSKPGKEANLDIQYTEGMTWPTPNIYYSTGGTPPFIPSHDKPTNTNEPYLDWINFILNESEIPQTITTSYDDDEQTVPNDYAVRVCNSFAQLGARGVSVLFSSGDFGVGRGECLTNDGTDSTRFQPSFPASCPFVTTVGGTIGVNPEQAVSFSGGGFSNYFAQPSYQSGAVSAFLANLGTTNQGLFNVSGRAYPDVSAQGQGFQIVVGGQTMSVGGTSASSPTFAGVVALLNDFRISNGNTALGFLNPLFYSVPAALNDITAGSNTGCGTNGFTAGAGWDPVTGLGTPDFEKMQSLYA